LPTSSIDYFALARELSSEFDIFLLDFPGHGLSDKPPEPYFYSLYDDARLLVHAITAVWIRLRPGCGSLRHTRRRRPSRCARS